MCRRCSYLAYWNHHDRTHTDGLTCLCPRIIPYKMSHNRFCIMCIVACNLNCQHTCSCLCAWDEQNARKVKQKGERKRTECTSHDRVGFRRQATSSSATVEQQDAQWKVKHWTHSCISLLYNCAPHNTKTDVHQGSNKDDAQGRMCRLYSHMLM